MASVLDGEGESVQARAVQEVRQGVHETERYHRVQAQRYPPGPMSSACVITQHHGHQELADVVADRDYTCGDNSSYHSSNQT